MNLLNLILRSHAYFAPAKSGAYNEDTNPLASSASYKPIADPLSAAWLQLADEISDAAIDPTAPADPTTAPSSGGAATTIPGKAQRLKHLGTSGLL